jgi:penicillin-binding protein 1C
MSEAARRVPGRRISRAEWAAVLGAAAAFSAVAVAAAWLLPLPARLTSRHSTVVEFRDGSPAHVFLAEDQRWRPRVSLAEVDPAYVEALVRFEDRRFFHHAGVDWLAVARAAGQNVAHRRTVSGASTLTMQLVRVLEPRPRTLASKAVEALRAFQLELRLSKREILEAYLQFAPYGRNVEGVEAASLAYFGHRATHLSAAEIATLLAVPQNPNRRFPSPENRARLAAARDDIARRLFTLGVLKRAAVQSPEAALEQVKATAVPAALTPFPRRAPHAALWFRQRRPGDARIRTTLDPGVQRVAERLLTGARQEAALKGIHNGATVVVDHRSGDVVALVGSFDFWDMEHGGQIIGFDLPRSPGSALKPVLYALAIDRGLSGPDQLVPDVPATFGSYAPRNFDGQFQGVVRLEDALSKSLNLPFIHLLQRAGVETLVGVLRQLGVESLRGDPGHYGLSTVVGGVELTPLELASVYTAFAQRGRFRPLRTLAGAPTLPSVAVFSEGATFLTRQALSLKDRPDFPERRRLGAVSPDIHWKTGTSFGHRDAWSAGSSVTHTVVVWMGNFDNRGSKRLVGGEAAAPLMFDLLEAITEKGPVRAPPAMPEDLAPVEVCAFSGHLPGDACPERSWTYAVRRAVPTQVCPYHVALDVDLDTGQAVTPACRAGRRYERRSFVTFPASVRRWLKDDQRLLAEPPAVMAGCELGGERKGPTIVSPAAGQVAMLVKGLPAEEQEIALEAEAAVAGEELTWFVDGARLGSAKADERLFWTPSLGRHEIWVTDGAGRSARRVLEVRARPF